MNAVELHSGWTVRAVGGILPSEHDQLRGQSLPASVPGCVHTDLMAAGFMDDPVLDQNELASQWPANTDWEYRCTFDAGDALDFEHVWLCFDGIDTAATILLNGRSLGEVTNMHRRYRFDVKANLQTEGNELVVRFAAPLPYMLEQEKIYGKLPCIGQGTNPARPHVMVRKMACNSGWDWGPQLTTVGLWKPVRLESWNGAAIGDVSVQTVKRGDGVLVNIDVDVRGGGLDRIDYELVSPTGQTQSVGMPAIGPCTFPVRDPMLWNPHTHGQPSLYDLTIRLMKGDEILDTQLLKIGLRTSELDTSPDEDGKGSTYRLLINGKPVFVRGANWIPDDIFPHRAGRERLRDRLSKAKEAGLNYLRVWGGGLYESDDFYELCDELGLLVQQDFLFACGMYPEEEPYRSEVEAEASDNVGRLSRFASLCLWNGNNENLWGYFFWHVNGSGFPGDDRTWGQWATGEGRTWGGGYYFDLLPKIVEKFGNGTPFYAGSPFPGSMDLPHNSDDHGTRHEWVRRYEAYRESSPRFMAEFGAQALPTRATLAKAVSTAPVPGDEHLAHRQRGGTDADRIDDPIRHYFGSVPTDLDSYHYLSQLAQVRQVENGAAWWRSTFPRCNGIIYWQWNDCWPVTSWAAIDCDPEFVARRKLLWYATRRFYAGQFLTIQPTAAGSKSLEIIAHNDTDEPWPLGEPLVALVDFESHIVESSDLLAGEIPPRSAKRWEMSDLGEIDPSRQMIRVNDADWFFAPDHELKLAADAIEATVEAKDGGYHVHVTAKSLVRDLCLLIDIVSPDAEVDRQMITLLPGETQTFRVRCQKLADPELLTRPPALTHVGSAMKPRP